MRPPGHRSAGLLALSCFIDAPRRLYVAGLIASTAIDLDRRPLYLGFGNPYQRPVTHSRPPWPWPWWSAGLLIHSPGTSPRARRGCGCSGRFQDPCRPGSATRAGAGLRPNRPYRYHLGAGPTNEPPLLPVLPARMTTRGYAPNVRFVGKDSDSDPTGPPTGYRTDRESWIMQRCWTE